MSLLDRDLDARVALVTGAGSGIGRSTAQLLAAAGAHVVAADIDEAAAQATAETVIESGASASGVGLDVRSTASVDQVVADVAGTHGRIDVLANVAGIIRMAPIAKLTDDDLDAVLDTNFKGPFRVARAVVPHMVAAGRGSIVNVVSSAIDVAAPGYFAYTASKGALVQLTRVLAVEVGEHGVRVNAVAPGWTPTGMTGRHFLRPDGTIDDDAFEQVAAPMRRLSPLGQVGHPDDIAHAILYLASDAARFTTGQILRTDGGVSLR